MKKLAIILLGFIPAVALSQVQPYNLQALCGPTLEFKKVLEEYKEEPQWSAKDGNGFLITVWENKTTKSFSLLKTNADGSISCLLASGMGYQN